MRAVLISGVVALGLTAAVAAIWWRGRRWTKSQSSSSSPPATHVAAFSRTTGPGGSSEESDPGPEADRRTGGDQLASRLVRDAAVRAAALREAWDHSYREARSPRAAEGAGGTPDVSTLLQDVLREQRETNALLRELVAGLRQFPD